MKFFAIVSLLILLGTDVSWAKSAQRYPGEFWKQARQRVLKQRILFPLPPQTDFNETAVSVAGPLKNINFASVPDLGNNINLMAVFHYLRDTRFIYNPASPKTQRRISWKYPDDGCYIRAELMTTYMEARMWSTPKKLFVFGDLAVKTPNSLSGVARWWYHVASVVRVNEVVYILDPSIDYNKPLTVLQWKQAMSAEGVGPDQFALCHGHTFEPDYNCLKPQQADLQTVIFFQKTFHNYEWQRLLELGRDPSIEL